MLRGDYLDHNEACKGDEERTIAIYFGNAYPGTRTRNSRRKDVQSWITPGVPGPRHAALQSRRNRASIDPLSGTFFKMSNVLKWRYTHQSTHNTPSVSTRHDLGNLKVCGAIIKGPASGFDWLFLPARPNKTLAGLFLSNEIQIVGGGKRQSSTWNPVWSLLQVTVDQRRPSGDRESLVGVERRNKFSSYYM